MAVFYTKEQVDAQAGEIGKRLKAIRESLKIAEQELVIQKSINKDLITRSESKNFKFSITSSDQNSSVSRKITQFFDKNLSSYAADWTLLKNGIFLANSSGVKSSEDAITLPNEIIVINNNTLDFSKDTYELITYATYLELEDIDSVSNEDKVQVESFGSGTKSCKFKVKGHLIVPDTLPKSLEDCSGMFAGASKFNQDISSWDVSNIRYMDNMFQDTVLFNRDLSSWNVVEIPQEPNLFSEGTSSWVLPKPKWGQSNSDIIEKPVYTVHPFSLGSEDFIFNTTNSVDSTSELPIVLGLYSKVGGTWSLYDEYTGILIADHTGFSLEEVIVVVNQNPDTSTYVEIFLNRTTGNNLGNYKLIGNIEYLSLVFNNLIRESTLEDTISIPEFSNYISNYSLITELASLSVPTSIPEAITDMSYMFEDAYSFNQDISTWNTSKVTNMSSMFKNAHTFNQDITGWDTTLVTDFSYMFKGAYDFNQNISFWDTASAEDMSSMFRSAMVFNQDLSKWDVSSVLSMESMFDSAETFNQDLSSWSVDLIVEEPFNFSLDATSWVLPQPKWGGDVCRASSVNINRNVGSLDVSTGVRASYRVNEGPWIEYRGEGYEDIISYPDYWYYIKHFLTRPRIERSFVTEEGIPYSFPMPIAGGFDVNASVFIGPEYYHYQDSNNPIFQDISRNLYDRAYEFDISNIMYVKGNTTEESPYSIIEEIKETVLEFRSLPGSGVDLVQAMFGTDYVKIKSCARVRLNRGV